MKSILAEQQKIAPIIKIKNVSINLNEKAVLSDFSYEIMPKGAFCFFGKSGCGKTTLFNIISKIIKPDIGKVEYSDDNMKLSVVFQEDRLILNLSAEKNLMLCCEKTLNLEECLKKSENSLKAVGLKEEKDNKVITFSGGMKRRVAIARALNFDGDLYLFDEAFKGLDKEIKKQILEIFREIKKEKTIIFITHDIDEAFYLADEIYFLNDSIPLKINEKISLKKMNDYEKQEIKERFRL